MSDTITVNGMRIREGKTLYMFKGLNLDEPLQSQDVEDVLKRTAKLIDANNDSTEQIIDNLKQNPEYYADQDAVFSFIEVDRVLENTGSNELKITDISTMISITFVENPTEYNFDVQPIESLSRHIGRTIFDESS